MIYTPRDVIYNRKGLLKIKAYLTIANHAFTSVIMFIVRLQEGENGFTRGHNKNNEKPKKCAST
jgi:hypothetical protein